MIRRLLLLNGLATLGAVMNHAVGWGFVAMFWWADRYRPVVAPNFDSFGSPSYYGLRMIEQLIIASIPAFLFVSGFFVAVATGRNQHTISWSVIRGRVVGLMIPYVLWSLVMFAVEFALLGVRYSAAKYLKLLAVGGATPAFYFVPLLCQLYILSPLLVPLVRQRWQLALGIALSIQLVVQLAQYPLVLGLQAPLAVMISQWLPSWTFPGYVFWFTWGVVVGFHLSKFKMWAASRRWLFLTLAVVMIPLGMFEWELLLRLSGQQWLAPTRVFSDELFSAALIMCFLAFNNVKLPFSNRLSELGTKSFGVYLVHSLVLVWTAKVIYRYAPWVLGHQLVFQPLLIVMGLGIPLLLMAAVNLSPARRYYQYIFG